MESESRGWNLWNMGMKNDVGLNYLCVLPLNYVTSLMSCTSQIHFNVVYLSYITVVSYLNHAENEITKLANCCEKFSMSMSTLFK